MNEFAAGATLAPSILSSRDIVVGIGLRQSATFVEMRDLLEASLAAIESGLDRVAILTTIDGKEHHPALLEMAEALGVSIVSVPRQALAEPVPNPSATVSRHLGVPSVAEAAAQIFGPLVAEKRSSANATCALSCRKEAQMFSAAIAASTLSTSVAGP